MSVLDAQRAEEYGRARAAAAAGAQTGRRNAPSYTGASLAPCSTAAHRRRLRSHIPIVGLARLLARTPRAALAASSSFAVVKMRCAAAQPGAARAAAKPRTTASLLPASQRRQWSSTSRCTFARMPRIAIESTRRPTQSTAASDGSDERAADEARQSNGSR